MNIGRTFLIMLAGLGLSGLNCSALENSLLRFHPGAGLQPRVAVRTDRLTTSDFGIKELDPSGLWPFAAVADVFSGGDPKLKESFKQEFYAKYSNTSNSLTTHPGCPLTEDPNLELYTYRKPYEIYQAEFLAWLEKHTGRQDFLSPQSRRGNDYRGNLASPLVRPGQLRNAKALKETFGQVATVGSGAVEIVIDNKYNPLRWIAPVNEVHHHEQPSWALLLRSTPEGLRQSEDVITDFWRGDRSRHIMLEYDVELTVEDERAEVGENSIYDMFKGLDLARADTLLEKDFYKARHYAELAPRPKEPAPCKLARQAMKEWIKGRFIPINIQTGLMINWCENGKAYRLSELMLAGKNQQPAYYYPPKQGEPGFLPTANGAVNPHIVDGGTAGNHGWARMPISVLRQDLFKGEEKKFPVIKAGGDYFAIPDGQSSRHLKGVLDVTNFYTLARRQQFLGGQRGYWVNKWCGFDGDDPQFARPDEKHAIYWIGLICEVHGPFRVTVRANKLNAWITAGQ